MSVEDKTGGALDTDSGAGGKDELVARETYLKAVDEVKALKAKLKGGDAESTTNLVTELRTKLNDANSKLDNFVADQKTAEDEKLKQQGEFKKLLEKREIELEEERSLRMNREKTLTDAQKLSAVLDKVGGSVESDYYGLIDVASIPVDESGNFDESIIDEVASAFVKKHQRVIDFGKGGKRLPNDAQKPKTITEMSYDEKLHKAANLLTGVSS